MAKKKASRKKQPRVIKPKMVSIGPASTKKKKPTKKTAKKKDRKKMSEITLLPAAEQPSVLIPQNNRSSLTAWFSLYMKIDGEANAEQTIIAKEQDLERFLDYFTVTMNSDNRTLWTRSISEGFQKYLKKTRSERTGKKFAPTTINRVMATLRTAAKWIHAADPFIAGNPMARITDLNLPEPTWQGLTDKEMTRMKAAADLLLVVSTGANQWPHRDFSAFHLLYITAMRVTEFISLDLEQYDGTNLLDVQRKGKTITPEIFLVKYVREALDAYIDEERGDEPGPLFQTRTGKRLSIQQVDYLLKRIAGQANATLNKKEHIQVHPHVLRHTMLRTMEEKKGRKYATEFAGHASEKYLHRYTLPTREQKQAALEEEFG